VLAGSAIPSDWSAWERMVDDLRVTWEERERETIAPAFPMLPEVRKDWLDIEEFRRRIELALERNRRDRLRFSLHRLQFGPSAPALEQLAAGLPRVLRDTDCLCRPAGTRVLLLTAVPREQFPHVRRRILALWQEAWLGAGHERPIPGISEERIELSGPDDAEAFLARAADWLVSA
jgi:hypothetical protein